MRTAACVRIPAIVRGLPREEAARIRDAPPRSMSLAESSFSCITLATASINDRASSTTSASIAPKSSELARRCDNQVRTQRSHEVAAFEPAQRWVDSQCAIPQHSFPIPHRMPLLACLAVFASYVKHPGIRGVLTKIKRSYYERTGTARQGSNGTLARSICFTLAAFPLRLRANSDCLGTADRRPETSQ